MKKVRSFLSRLPQGTMVPKSLFHLKYLRNLVHTKDLSACSNANYTQLERSFVEALNINRAIEIPSQRHFQTSGPLYPAHNKLFQSLWNTSASIIEFNRVMNEFLEDLRDAVGATDCRMVSVSVSNDCCLMVDDQDVFPFVPMMRLALIESGIEMSKIFSLYCRSSDRESKKVFLMEDYDQNNDVSRCELLNNINVFPGFGLRVEVEAGAISAHESASISFQYPEILDANPNGLRLIPS